MSEVTNTQEVQEYDAKDLKILAYRQRVGEQEEQIVDLRVQLTFVSNELQGALAKIAELEGEVVTYESDEKEES